jgi:hypothetical protein
MIFSLVEISAKRTFYIAQFNKKITVSHDTKTRIKTKYKKNRSKTNFTNKKGDKNHLLWRSRKLPCANSKVARRTGSSRQLKFHFLAQNPRQKNMKRFGGRNFPPTRSSLSSTGHSAWLLKKKCKPLCELKFSNWKGRGLKFFELVKEGLKFVN